jgi:hypothetical protein
MGKLPNIGLFLDHTMFAKNSIALEKNLFKCEGGGK